jgi:AsmA protein
MVRIGLFSLAVVAAVAIALLFVAPRLIATDTLKDKALAQIEAATGYRVRIDGPVKLAVFPSLDLVARDVGIAQPQGDRAAEFVTAKALRLDLRLGALLGGKVQMTEMMLIDPRIALPLPSRQRLPSEPGTAEPGAPEEAPDNTPRQLTLDKIHIRNGTIILPGADGAPAKSITGLNLGATLPHASGPLAFTASGVYGGDQLNATGSIGSFAHFLEGNPAPLQMAIEAPDVLPDGVTINGTISFKDDILTLVELAAKSGAHALTGNAAYADDTLTITDGTFNGTPFAGRATLRQDTLNADIATIVEGKSVRVTGTVNTFDQFLDGAPAPVTLAIDAPEKLLAGASLSGTASYKDGILTVTPFTANVAEYALSGTATYRDKTLSLTDFTAASEKRRFAGNALYKDDAMSVDMIAELDGKPAKVTGSVSGIDHLLNGQFALASLEVEAPELLAEKASVEGQVAYRGNTLTFTEIAAVSGDLRLNGSGSYESGTLRLDPVTAETGGQRLTGTVTANVSADVPDIVANLSVTSTGGAATEPEPKAPPPPDKPAAAPASAPVTPENPFAKPPGTETDQTGQAAPETAPAEAPAHPQAPPPGSGIEARLAPLDADSGAQAPAPAPQPGAPPAQATGPGWSTENIGLPPLKAVNGTFTLALKNFAHGRIKIAAATVKATLSGGKLTAEVPSLEGYGGSGSATFAIDASGAVPAHRLTLSLANVDAAPFLTDVARIRRVEGKAAIALDLAASGASERAIADTLTGSAQFKFSDGALLGLNVAKMLRSLTTGVLTGWQFKQEARTAFSTFSAGFKLANGQAQTDDLRLIGPLVSMGGAGTVNIPGQSLKLRVNPFMLASVEGTAGKKSTLGFPVPIAVTGPWDRPFFYPDIPGILENPVAAYKQLNKLGGGLIAVPAKMLGIDTGEGGLVEKGVALPGAITKGVVGGIGQVLGTKKQDEGEGEPAAAEGEQPAPLPADAAEPQGADAAPPAEAPVATEAQVEQPQVEAAPKKKPAPEPAPNQMMQNMFGN